MSPILSLPWTISWFVNQTNRSKGLLVNFNCSVSSLPEIKESIWGLIPFSTSSLVISMVQSNIRPSHCRAVKRIFQYLQGTTNYVLCYLKTNLWLRGYSDVPSLGYACVLTRWRGHLLVQQEAVINCTIHNGIWICGTFSNNTRGSLVLEVPSVP